MIKFATIMDKEFTSLLEKHQLRKTAPRLSVLSILKSRKTATSQPELEAMIGKDVDRVTLYRILKTFEEKGIIHKILDLNGTANYAICESSCNEHDHKDNHVHFNCTVCLDIYCLENLQIPNIKMPSGFVPHTTNLIVYGICEKCSEKAEQYVNSKSNK
ncbi:Fur family ferric uptake transcriptional regulator [Aquimarina sp. MAR_2010_214]|uniref:Fur family transcriptional regulator n=1 Tax=Aquimarina sp. MAR_2010_214 TaxID=1250026 RepID=UPI000CCA3174|nr:transcriptional repressor [Aquimarina sp. MAR_2010_214]PKV52598.1 Fur family ferric uptake transcriptional regulator [Aquimarina sp. MAR_2010_214]